MGHYVYRYMHPDYPWLYVGKTDSDLCVRIRTHQNSIGDNISREFLPLLKEATVYYIELENSLQTTYVEKILIDKHKPYLNKLDKIEDSTCPLEIGKIEWKKFEFPPRVTVVEKPTIRTIKEVETIKEPVYVYRNLTKDQEKRLSMLCYYESECDNWRREFASIKETGMIASSYNESVHGRMFQPNASDFINYYKRNRGNSSKALHFLGIGHDCFGKTLYFDFDDGRASIAYSSNHYYENIKSAYVDAEGFKEIVHIMQVLGGVYGVSKRDYELFLNYFEDRKERNGSTTYCDEKIKALKETISLIEENKLLFNHNDSNDISSCPLQSAS